MNMIEIQGVDFQHGLSMTGGTIEKYINVLSMYRTDVENKMPLIKTMPDKDSLRAFAIQVHALKSASATIGAASVSAMALQLETAAKAGDYTFIENNLNKFAADMENLVAGIKNALQSYYEKSLDGSSADGSSAVESSDKIKPLLNELKEALTAEKSSSEIFVVLDKINLMQLDVKSKEIFEKISFNVLMNEFNEALEILKSF